LTGKYKKKKMGFSYQISDPRGTYFVTFATMQWPQAGRHLQCRPTDKKGFVIRSNK
jgi:hypothetical protein